MLYSTPMPVVLFKEPNAAPFLLMKAIKKTPTSQQLQSNKEIASAIGTFAPYLAFIISFDSSLILLHML